MTARLKVGTILAGAALAATTLAGTAMAGSNLVQNGTFEADTSGWITTQGASFSLSDSGGGARLTNMHQASFSTRASVTQCVAVPGGTELRLSGRALNEAGQARDGIGRFGVSFHDSANCGEIDRAQGAELGEIGAAGAWQEFGANFETGPEIRSVMVILTAEKADATGEQPADGTFSIAFDDIELAAVAPELAPATADGDATVETAEAGDDGSAGPSMPLIGGVAAGLLGLFGLGVVLRRTGRNA